MSKTKICMFFSDTGAGHRSAAEAVEAALIELASRAKNIAAPDVVLDNIVEKSNPLSRWLVAFYNYLLMHHQDQMKHYYWFVQAAGPNQSKVYYQLVKTYLCRLIEEQQPQVIVSIHPMLNHYLAWALKDMGLSTTVRLLTVVTDPNEYLWTGWACPEVDLIFAPNVLARNRLVQLGVTPERIKIVGMPVHPAFLKPPIVPRTQFLSLLGLDPFSTTICINAGWAGGGNLLKVYRALAKVRKHIQVVFICGNNQKLFEQVSLQSQSIPIPTAVLPIHDSMSDLMSACDLMVTKSGGLTTFECIARRLPMALDLITQAMPQESGTACMLIDQGLARGLSQPSDIVEVVDNHLEALQRNMSHLPAAYNLSNTNAIYSIAQTIRNACDPHYDLLSQPASIFPLRKSESPVIH